MSRTGNFLNTSKSCSSAHAKPCYWILTAILRANLAKSSSLSVMNDRLQQFVYFMPLGGQLATSGKPTTPDTLVNTVCRTYSLCNKKLSQHLT